jgi:mutator family transposase
VWLGRACYERRPDSEPAGMRNGFRARTLQTAEGELSVEIAQVREAAAPFVSKLFPRGTKLLRTEPLEALVIGAFVRGLSMRDVESLCEEAGLGSVSKATASRICRQLRERFEASKRRISTTSGSSRWSSTRPSSRFARAARRRASWSPGGSPTPARACCCRCCWGCASPMKTGRPSGATSSPAYEQVFVRLKPPVDLVDHRPSPSHAVPGDRLAREGPTGSVVRATYAIR